LPLALLQFALVAGAVEVDVAELESAIVSAGDRVRMRSCHTFVEGRQQVDEQTLVEGDLQLVLGPAPVGGFLRVTAKETPAAGEPFAPTAVRGLTRADQHWDLGLGCLAAAPVLR
jgi:hypothetical protein